MTTLDLILFVVAVVGVIALGIWKSKDEDTQGEKGARDYFLAGRGLTWWLVGFSLIAANISTEQFVGMSGKAADWLGMAIASYEWMAAVTLVVVAFVFLPKLLRCGLYTIPEFLEYRYGVISRTVMAIATMVILVGVPTASVIYSGAKVVSVFAADTPLVGNLQVACWAIGIFAAVYVFIGGLKACAWTDLVWGVGLILGGALIAVLAFQRLGSADAEALFATKVQTSSATVEQIAEAGAFERFQLLNSGEVQPGPNMSGGKLHMQRPATDPEIPWTALILGLWIPNFFYWGLNQYIVQRTLGSKSLAEGQKGVVFAAALKLIIPFVVVIPGILAFNLFNQDLKAEAMTKNLPVMAQYQAGMPMVYDYSLNFASVSPGEAAEILAFNAVQLDLPPPAALLEATDEDFFAANRELVVAARAAGLPVSTTLVGYDYDAAFGVLLKNLLFPGISWFVLAAITGAVISSLASMLNSASTIATMDLVYKVFPNLDQPALVKVGRACVVLFVLIACLIAPTLDSPRWGGIFTFIQEFQGFISPGVLAIFLFGFLVPKAPRYFGWLGIVLNAVLYGLLKVWLGPWLAANGWWYADNVAFLDRMGICFLVVLLTGFVLTLVDPLEKPVELPVSTEIAMESSPAAKIGGIAVVIATIALYIIFW
ncbi:MAG: sodium:solute symporter family transporter [Opitutales bacterium]